MTQTTTLQVNNGNGALVRSNINTILAALASNNSSAGVSPPATTAGMLWINTATTPYTMYIRNTTNDGWIDVTDIVREALCSGIVFTDSTSVTASDTFIEAFGKLQAQLTTTNNSLLNKASKGANSDITSITGLTTPLSTSQGGTGLSVVGNSGLVLKSNGSGNVYGNTSNYLVGVTTTGVSYLDFTIPSHATKFKILILNTTTDSNNLLIAQLG